MAFSGDTIRRLALACNSDSAANEIIAALDALAAGEVEVNPTTLGVAAGEVIVQGYLEKSHETGITAFAGGGQSSARALTNDFNRVTTVATAADSVRLPASVAGKEVVVINDTVTAMQVFGASTDTIDGIATGTGISQVAGSTVIYRCLVAGNWIATLPQPANQSASNTAGTAALASGDMEGAAFCVLTCSGQAAITKTTRTAAQIQANVPNFKVGQTYRLRIVNSNTGTLTTTGGSNVTMTSTIPANYFADYIVTFATATTVTATQIATAPSVTLPPSKFVTINVTTGTLAAGNAGGAQVVELTSTNAIPGAQAMRTPAQVLADSQAAGLAIGMTYVLRIRNTGAGTFTLATDSGAGFTMTGTMTVLTNSVREFTVTISTATTGIVQDCGSPSDLNLANGVAPGYKIARGVHQQAAASDTIASGLATVVAVVVSWRDTPTAKQTFLTATIGDQAGTPAAGSFLSKTFKSTYAAADDFTDNLSFNWIAIGT